MFQYFYRIFDRHRKKIYTIAIFTDAKQSFKPAAYEYQFHGTYLNYTFNTYKLLDQDEKELLQSGNPFAYVVLAGIYSLKSKRDMHKRFAFKQQLFDLLLHNKGEDAHAYVDKLLTFIDYLLNLPEELTTALQENIKSKVGKEGIEMEKTKWPDPPTLKPFIDEGRKRGRKEGRKEGREEVKRHIVYAMLKKDYLAKEIIEITGISETELNEIQNEVAGD